MAKLIKPLSLCRGGPKRRIRFINEQLSQRRGSVLSHWGASSINVSLAETIIDIIRDVYGWCNGMFVPMDPMKILMYTGWHRSWVYVSIRLEKELGIRPPCDGVALWSMTLGEVVCYYERISDEGEAAMPPLRCSDLGIFYPAGTRFRWLRDLFDNSKVLLYRDLEAQAKKRQGTGVEFLWEGRRASMETVREVREILANVCPWCHGELIPDDPMGWFFYEDHCNWLGICDTVNKRLGLNIASDDPSITLQMTVGEFVDTISDRIAACNSF